MLWSSLGVFQVVAYQKLGFAMEKSIAVQQKKMNHHLVPPKSENVVIRITSDAITENVYRNDGAVIMILVNIFIFELPDWDYDFYFYCKSLDCSDKSDEINCTMRNCSESEFRYFDIYHKNSAPIPNIPNIYDQTIFIF